MSVILYYIIDNNFFLNITAFEKGGQIKIQKVYFKKTFLPRGSNNIKKNTFSKSI